jgi:predicted dehydrogenase
MAHAPSLKVALIGYGFMGAAHSQGWRVAPRFYDLPARPEMAVLVGRTAAGVKSAAEQWGWAASSTDWRCSAGSSRLSAGLAG